MSTGRKQYQVKFNAVHSSTVGVSPARRAAARELEKRDQRIEELTLRLDCALMLISRQQQELGHVRGADMMRRKELDFQATHYRVNMLALTTELLEKIKKNDEASEKLTEELTRNDNLTQILCQIVQLAFSRFQNEKIKGQKMADGELFGYICSVLHEHKMLEEILRRINLAL